MITYEVVPHNGTIIMRHNEETRSYIGYTVQEATEIFKGELGIKYNAPICNLYNDNNDDI